MKFLSFTLVFIASLLVTSRAEDLTDTISVTFSCVDETDLRVIIKQTSGAVKNWYIALGPGDAMDNMDPTICTINNTNGMNC